MTVNFSGYMVGNSYDVATMNSTQYISWIHCPNMWKC